MYSGGKALRFSNNTAHAKEPVDFTSSGDVVLMARAGQSGGSPKLRVSVNGTFTAPAKAITNSGAPRAYTFEAGHYKFDVTTDDGVRLYVDGVPLLNHWYDNSERMFATKTMTAGEHQIKVEHYDGGLAAKLSVAWTKTTEAAPVMAADDFVGRHPVVLEISH